MSWSSSELEKVIFQRKNYSFTNVLLSSRSRTNHSKKMRVKRSSNVKNICFIKREYWIVGTLRLQKRFKVGNKYARVICNQLEWTQVCIRAFEKKQNEKWALERKPWKKANYFIEKYGLSWVIFCVTVVNVL